MNLMALKIGSKGSAVWELQKLLTAQGYEIPVDGVFSIETDKALKDFQRINNVFPSGITDEETIRILIAKD
jgi:peptidoglycan hydrolase-like protein with peptidoglycan-binding domain